MAYVVYTKTEGALGRDAKHPFARYPFFSIYDAEDAANDAFTIGEHKDSSYVMHKEKEGKKTPHSFAH